MLRLVKSSSRERGPRPRKAGRLPGPGQGQIDYSDLRQGRPGEVFEDLARTLGDLNLNSFNIKIGVTSQPGRVWSLMVRERPWSQMKLLWTTACSRHARQMAEMLHAWDAKLYLDGSCPPPEADDPGGSPYYAFAVVRKAS
jgi:hypothetical protein